MAVKLDIKNLPVWAKIIVVILPSVIITALVIYLLIKPKQLEIKKLDTRIDKQINQIAEAQTKAARLDELKAENERLLERIMELKAQLPEEKEISDLLKQVSDLGLGSGLEIKSWKPKSRTLHEGGIVYRIPVSVDMTGSYHNLGYFLSSLTRLNRIVNIGDMKLSPIKARRGQTQNLLSIALTASTFTAVPEEELAAQRKAAAETTKKGKGKRRKGKEKK